MDDYANAQYDYFGELSSPEESFAASKPPPMMDAKSNSTAVVEDSLMEFISEYFRGDVNNDFSIMGQDVSLQPPKPNWTQERMAVDEPKSLINPLNFTVVSSDESTSLELFSSADSSLLNGSVDSLKSHPDEDRVSRRKSISYEIRFINSKDENGKIKICILPNPTGPSMSPPPASKSVKIPSDALPPKGKVKPNELNEKESLRGENELLRTKVKVLEKKLNCVEKESERVVGELKRIIERKNEAISQLELQVAGIEFMEGSA